MSSNGRGKCPNCGIEVEVSQFIFGEFHSDVYIGICPKCGRFQTVEVWGIKYF